MAWNNSIFQTTTFLDSSLSPPTPEENEGYLLNTSIQLHSHLCVEPLPCLKHLSLLLDLLLLLRYTWTSLLNNKRTPSPSSYKLPLSSSMLFANQPIPPTSRLRPSASMVNRIYITSHTPRTFLCFKAFLTFSWFSHQLFSWLHRYYVSSEFCEVKGGRLGVEVNEDFDKDIAFVIGYH